MVNAYKVPYNCRSKIEKCLVEIDELPDDKVWHRQRECTSGDLGERLVNHAIVKGYKKRPRKIFVPLSAKQHPFDGIIEEEGVIKGCFDVKTKPHFRIKPITGVDANVYHIYTRVAKRYNFLIFFVDYEWGAIKYVKINNNEGEETDLGGLKRVWEYDELKDLRVLSQKEINRLKELTYSQTKG